MAPHSFRVLLKDCYDLPPKTYQVREVPLTDEQERLYREMRDYATAKLSEQEHVTATIVITQMLRLHQILCGHVRNDLGEVREVSENRTDAVMEVLEEYGPDGKAIIWACYDPDVQKIAARLAREYGPGSVARFWGGNRSTREEEEAKFKTDPQCRFMVATAAAGGRGRTWDMADLVIYYASKNDLEHREQSEERPQNVGKVNSVLYVDLVAVPSWGGTTVDHKFLNALRGKIDMAATISGDDWREWIV
jgi:SNF2 family DNA or RNA helicase